MNSRQAATHICVTAKSFGYVYLSAEIERLGILRISGSSHSSVTQHLFASVIGQQLSAKAADTIWRRVLALADQKGCAISIIVENCPENLRACGVSGRKVETMRAITHAERLGHLADTTLAALSSVQRAAELSKIWGVGRWTADMVSIFYYLDADVWPDTDGAATDRLRALTDCEDTVELSSHFAPYRSYLARYMWLSKDNPGV